MSNPFSLEGRRAMVTGANTGIGQGIAISLAEAGAEVLAVGRSSMAETEDAIRGAGGKVWAIKADLGKTATVAPMLDAAWSDHGPIDILVNNAGIIRRAAAIDFTETDWDDVLDVNLKSVFLLSQAFARQVFAAGKQRAARSICRGTRREKYSQAPTSRL